MIDPIAHPVPASLRGLSETYGPWACITGASDGLGRALSEVLARCGFNLVLVARRRPELDQLAHEVTSCFGVECQIIAVDVGTAAGREQVKAICAGLPVGLFVAAAGFGTSGQFLDNPAEVETNMLTVNCLAVADLTHFFGNAFRQRGRGGLILFSSLLAFQGVARAANYAASKAYVQTLAEALRTELKPSGVDVLACAPGPVATGFAARADMKMGLALSPGQIATETLAALGKTTTVRPGWLSKLLEYSFLGQPRMLRSFILNKVMDGMTRHQEGAQA